MEAAENCVCVRGIWVVCEVPVWVIMRGGGCTVGVVARTLSRREPEDEEDGIGEGVCDEDRVDGKTTAVMTGAAAVVEISS